MTTGQSEADSTAAAAPRPAVARRGMAPFFRALGVTLVAQIAVALGGLALYRLLALKTGTTGFASYSLIKQAVSFLFPVVTVGLVGGLPRYIALRTHGGDRSPERYLAAGAAISGVAVTLAAAAALAAPQVTASLFFGDAAATQLVGPFVALLAATAAFYIAYGYFRGHLQAGRASLLQVAGLAAVPPLVVVALPGQPIGDLVLLMAIGLAVLSLAAVARPLARGVRQGAAELRPAGSVLLGYGGRRVPGEIAQVALFAAVPVLAAHVTTLREVAYLTAGQQLLSMLAIAMVPLGLTLLPSVARMWERDREAARRNVTLLAAFAAHIALFLVGQVLVFADVAVTIWLGPEFAAAAPIVRLVAAPAGPFVFYLALRSALDAASVRSYNARSNLVAVTAFALTAAATLVAEALAPAMAVAAAFAVGVSVQGLLTFTAVRSLFGVRTGDYALQVAVPLALLTAAGALAARPAITGASTPLPWLVLTELVLAGLYFGLLLRSRQVVWPRTLLGRMRARTG